MIAAVVVLGAVLSGSFPLVSVGAVIAVVLGAVAARITYSELAATRREAAADRARQAQSYRTMAEERSVEHREFAAAMQGRIERAADSVTQLESAVVASQGRAAQAMRKLGSEARRAAAAEAEGTRLAAALDESEERAAEAIVRVAELEQENDVLRDENTGLRADLAASSWPQARHA